MAVSESWVHGELSGEDLCSGCRRLRSLQAELPMRGLQIPTVIRSRAYVSTRFCLGIVRESSFLLSADPNAGGCALEGLAVCLPPLGGLRHPRLKVPRPAEPSRRSVAPAASCLGLQGAACFLPLCQSVTHTGRLSGGALFGLCWRGLRIRTLVS